MVYNLVSFLGLFILMFSAWIFSTNRKVINWRVVIWGVSLQLIFGVFIFILPAGTKVFLFVNDIVVKVLDNASAGTRFLFGRLALPPGARNEIGEESLGFILAFQALPTIVFFASLMGMLYYIGVMPRLIGVFAKAFTRLMRISGAESLCASSNIFVGVESAMTIRPYLKKMTCSELCTVLTAGMSTIASSVMALYVFILREQFPTIAGHLISASILSAPAGVVMSKLLIPETESPETLGIDIKPYYEKESSGIEAVISGANAGLKLVVGIVALLLAFLGLISLIDFFISGSGIRLNAILGINIDWSLKGLLGYVFYPFTLALGVPPQDAFEIARVIGERTVATEVKSYQDLAVAISQGVIKEPRSILIAVYALCGFAHVASLAIFVGGTSALVPERIGDLSRVGLRALLGATLACLMTACIAGMLYREGALTILSTGQ